MTTASTTPARAGESRIRLRGCAVELPLMGLGTWAWGDRSTWGMNAYDRSYNVDTIRDAYRASVAAGITFLDTAEAYGNGESERIIGRLLEEDREHREHIVVATKFIPFPWKVAVGSALMTSLKASLQRLRMPSVHLYQIHGPISLRSHAAMAGALAAAQRGGLVKAVGVSNYSEKEMRAIHAGLAQCGVALATNQVEYSLLRTMPESDGLLSACKELGVVLLAYPMAEIDPVIAELRRIGAAHGDKTPSQVALNWIICKGAVPIPGAKNKAQAEQNAGALGWRLTSDEVEALDAVSKHGQRKLMHRVWQHG
jgi:aryl-alcohol dehydrogenase-like predicted oxidoreductase